MYSIKKNAHPFPLTKNGTALNWFWRHNNQKLVETNIPKEGYNPYVQEEQDNRIHLDEEREEIQNINQQNDEINLLHSNIINTMREDIFQSNSEA